MEVPNALLVLLALVVILLVALYKYITWHYGSLETLGIPVVPPIFCFGSVPDLHRQVFQQIDIEFFHRYGKMWGLYEGRQPMLFTVDADFIKDVTVKHFDSFHSRRIFSTKHPSAEMLDLVIGEKWKVLRAAQTPSFTSGKLKQMATMMDKCTENLARDLLQEVKDKPVQNIRGILSALGTDVIGLTVFGTKIQSLREPNSEFREMLERIALLGPVDSLIPVYISTHLPFLQRFFDVFDGKALDYFTAMTRDLINQRRKSNQKFGDFIDSMLEMEQQVKGTDNKLNITEYTLIAQAINFLLAGFDTTSTSLSFTLYHLAQNQELQQKAFEEVSQALEEAGGKITYEMLQGLPYVTACLTEAMRMHSTIVRLERLCHKDFVYKGMKVKKGTLVMIPLWALHRNPEYFPDPEVFDPDRHLAENKGRIHQYALIPFGAGPRNCIGMRYAWLQMKVAMCHLLSTFQFSIAPETKIKYETGGGILVRYGPIHLRMESRQM